MASREACSLLILGDASASREKNDVQFILVFANTKADLYFAVSK